MKRYILKLLGIPDFKKEIQDLKKTVETLKSEATKTYKIYEDAFCFIKGLDIQDKNVPWWEQKDLRFDGNNYETMRLVENIKKSKQVEFATNNPSLKIRKIFHGGCLSCQTPLDKGIGTCTGCQYLMGWDYPDLSTKKNVSHAV
jgi:hypothetical protein